MTLEDERAYRYWGFISYSRHDSRVAKLLEHRLSRQSVPRQFRNKTSHGDKRLTPLFLDVQEAAANRSLTTEIEMALAASAKLIVICSPFAASSRYVADEIRYFQSIGRDKDILCLIASGVPGGSMDGKPQLECFPSPLLWRHPPPQTGADGSAPLAAALGGESEAEWRLATRQLAAGIFDVSIDALRLARQRRALKNVILYGSLGTLLCAASLLAAWAYVWPHDVYARQFVRRWGVWEPVDRVSRSVARHLESTLRFRYRGAFGPLREVRSVDSYGECHGNGLQSIVGDPFKFEGSDAKACGARFEFSEGRIQSEQVFDQFDNALETLSYHSPQVAILTEAVIGTGRREGNIEILRFTRTPSGSEAGFDRRIEFLGGDDKSPRPNAQYAYGLEFEYDARGHPVRTTLLDEGSRPRVGANGFASVATTYGVNGAQIERSFRGLGGELVTSNDGYAVVRATQNSEGNDSEYRYFDLNRAPTYDQRGEYGLRIAYSEDGKWTSSQSIGADGEPSINVDGFAMIRRTQVQNSRIERTEFFDEHGQPTAPASTGCRIEETSKSADGSISESRCEDENRRPVYSLDGPFLYRRRSDERGQHVSEAYYGVDGRTPVYACEGGKDCGVHELRKEFDENGNMIRERYVGTHGEAVNNTDGIGSSIYQYDHSNRQREMRFASIDGRPTCKSDGNCGERYKRDSFGRIFEKEYLDESGRPSTNKFGVAKKISVYNTLGQVGEEDNLDLGGHPVDDELGEAIFRSEYDAYGRQVHGQYFDTDGKPTRVVGGYQSAFVTRDRWGRVAEFHYSAPDGSKIALWPGGPARVKFDRDRRGFAVRSSFLGMNDRPVLNANGLAGERSVVDKAGHVLLDTYLGLLGQIAKNKDGSAGWRSTYDATGHMRSFVTLGEDLRPLAAAGSGGIAIWINQYDDVGEVRYQFWFDANGKPIEKRDAGYGFSSMYDSRRREIERTFLSAVGEPQEAIDGVATIRRVYDGPTDALTEESYYDISGRPKSLGAAAMARFTNDAQGRMLEKRFLDDQGRLTTNDINGSAIKRFERDRFGRIVTETSLGLHGELVDRTDTHWATRSFTYQGDIVGTVTCTNTRGQPVSTCNAED